MLGDHKLMIGSVIDQIQREVLINCTSSNMSGKLSRLTSLDTAVYTQKKHSNDLIRISELSTDILLSSTRSFKLYLSFLNLKLPMFVHFIVVH